MRLGFEVRLEDRERWPCAQLMLGLIGATLILFAMTGGSARIGMYDYNRPPKPLTLPSGFRGGSASIRCPVWLDTQTDSWENSLSKTSSSSL